MTRTTRNAGRAERTSNDDAAMAAAERPDGVERDDGTDRPARYMARELCAGFRYHDRGERAEAVASFHEVDRRQFAHLDDGTALDAAEAYVEALFAKDAVEAPHRRERDGRLDREPVADADWSPVRSALADRAAAVGMDPAYAEATARSWRNHKTGGDYWSPMLRAQLVEFRAAIGADAYPDKPSDGLAGAGPEPVRYLLGAELHDLHDPTRWEEALRVMTPYFDRILRAHGRE